MTKATLEEILKKHALYLAGDPVGSRADLSDANLSDANLSRAGLRFANLSRADLSGVTYSGDSIFLNTKGVNILTATFGRHQVVSIDANAGVGCHFYPLDFWVSNYDRIGEKAGYTPDEIRVYGNILKFFHKTRNTQKGKS